VDDVRLDAVGELGQRRNHPEAPQHGHAEERVELLELMDVESFELAARIDATRRDVDLVAALREPPRPPREVARLRVPDAEDAQSAVSHRLRG
jgi:hypothetical protein